MVNGWFSRLQKIAMSFHFSTLSCNCGLRTLSTISKKLTTFFFVSFFLYPLHITFSYWCFLRITFSFFFPVLLFLLFIIQTKKKRMIKLSRESTFFFRRLISSITKNCFWTLHFFLLFQNSPSLFKSTLFFFLKEAIYVYSLLRQ